MPYIKVNDIQMYYEIHGDGEPLVLIVGLEPTYRSGRESFVGSQKNIKFWHLITVVRVVQTNPTHPIRLK
jgi:hypothetical protein